MALSKKDQELHDELLSKLIPLTEFLQANGFGYWLTVGREGTSANYCGGKKEDVTGAVLNLCERNPQIAEVLQEGLDRMLD